MYIGPWQEYELAQVCKPSIPKHQSPLGASSRNEVVQALEDFLREADAAEEAQSVASSRTDKTAKLRHILAKLTQPTSARHTALTKPQPQPKPTPKVHRSPVSALTTIASMKPAHVSAAMQRVARMKEVYTRAARKQERVETSGPEVHHVAQPQEARESHDAREALGPVGMSVAQLEEIEALHDEGTAGLEALDTFRSEQAGPETQLEQRSSRISPGEEGVVIEEAEAEEDLDELLKWTRTIDDEIKLLEHEELPEV